jgi:hypothetical protein
VFISSLKLTHPLQPTIPPPSSIFNKNAKMDFLQVSPRLLPSNSQLTSILATRALPRQATLPLEEPHSRLLHRPIRLRILPLPTPIPRPATTLTTQSPQIRSLARSIRQIASLRTRESKVLTHQRSLRSNPKHTLHLLRCAA